MAGDFEELWSSFLRGAQESPPEWDWGPPARQRSMHHFRRVQLLAAARSTSPQGNRGGHHRRATATAVALAFVLALVGTTAAIAATNKASSPSSIRAPGTSIGVVAESSRLSCEPSGVGLGRVCRLVFQGFDRGHAAGHHVCFFTTDQNAVLGTSGRCSITDGHGRADGVFFAELAGTATVTATEASPTGVIEGEVRITVGVGR